MEEEIWKEFHGNWEVLPIKVRNCYCSISTNVLKKVLEYRQRIFLKEKKKKQLYKPG